MLLFRSHLSNKNISVEQTWNNIGTKCFHFLNTVLRITRAKKYRFLPKISRNKPTTCSVNVASKVVHRTRIHKGLLQLDITF